MAARKEILDFFMLERTETPPTHEDVQAHALRITDIYNERKADLLTLQNDLFELVSESKIIYERLGAKHTMPDFEEAIIILIMTATDWELFLPETEVQRYEKVSLNVIQNLADFIRETYSHHQMQHGTPTPATQLPKVEVPQTMSPGTLTPRPTHHSETKPQERPQAALKPQSLTTTNQPQTNSVGRPIKGFVETIADKHTTRDNNKAEIIKQHIGTALQSMTDPKAVIALLIECFENDILKQCPSYPQVLEIVGTVEAYCPFGKHQPYGVQKNIYFDKEEAYMSLNETTSIQDNEISKYRLEAEKIVTDLLALLEPPTEPQKARHRTK